jgi:hypothetical protein
MVRQVTREDGVESEDGVEKLSRSALDEVLGPLASFAHTNLESTRLLLPVKSANAQHISQTVEQSFAS